MIYQIIAMTYITKLYIYADDTNLYRHIFNTADQDKLQKIYTG